MKIQRSSILDAGIDGNGYGYINDCIPDGLRANGVDIMQPSEFGWDILLQISPPRAASIGPYRYRPDLCYHTMIEGWPTSPKWVEILNRAHCIWAPSNFVRETFIDHGVLRPIFVAGYAVDTVMYRFEKRETAEQRIAKLDIPSRYKRKRAKERIENEPFKVLAWGDTMLSRKNILMAMKAFHYADIPNSVMEVKISDNMVRSTMRNPPTFDGVPDERIKVFSEYWERPQVVSWLHRGDLGVYLSGGEGGGLMPREMMATGLPVVCAANTGMLDYLKPEIALMVECPTTQVYPSMSVHMGYDFYGYTPNLEQAIAHLKWAGEHRQELYDMGERGAHDVRLTTWESQCAIAVKHLREQFGL